MLLSLAGIVMESQQHEERGRGLATDSPVQMFTIASWLMLRKKFSTKS
jgi:hypothetical protein